MKEDTQKASRICPRVEVTKDPKQLLTDIEVLTARVEKEQKGSVFQSFPIFFFVTFPFPFHCKIIILFLKIIE
jgi:hypothetical protein